MSRVSAGEAQRWTTRATRRTHSTALRPPETTVASSANELWVCGQPRL